MSKLNVFDAINKLVGNSVRIYTGPIHKLYADEFELVRGRPIYKKKNIIIKKHANFYISEQTGSDYENIEYGCVLLTHNEALIRCEETVNKNRTTIGNALSGRITDPKEAHRIINAIKKDSESLYYNPDELVYSHDISKKDFKQLIKSRDKNNTNKK